MDTLKKLVKVTLVPTNESKEKYKEYEKFWSKIRDLMGSITKNSNVYDEKYIKIKFNLDDKLPLNKTVEIPSMIIVARVAFYKNSKCYPQVFLDKCLYNNKAKSYDKETKI